MPSIWKRLSRVPRRLAGLHSLAPRTDCVLVTKSDCPLCDEMKDEIARAGRTDLYQLRVVDLESDPALLERYALSVPVLEIAGRPAFKGRLTAAAFLEKLAVRRSRRGS